ncbi:MAG: ANTAR domain-containing response regulator [Marinobacter sp.]
MTERIDAMKKVEDSIEGCFHIRYIERYAEARHSLAHQETLIASLDARKPGQVPMLVLCERLNENESGDAFSSEDAGQQLGRSIFDLLQEQTRRLQQMSNELQGAREALEDRKAQEKAVLLLMAHRRISNDEAHRMLRKLAMDRGKKLPEIARALLSMVDVLKY